MADQKNPNLKQKKEAALHLTIIKQMGTLATSGFGLVAALAWNNVIQELVNNHIKPYLPQGSSLMSLFIYALVITVFAVIITYNLSRIIGRLETLGSKKEVIRPDRKSFN